MTGRAYTENHILGPQNVYGISKMETEQVLVYVVAETGLQMVILRLPCIVKALCSIMGKSEELEKLTGTLLVNSSKIRNLLGWNPPFTLEEGIRKTVEGCKL